MNTTLHIAAQYLATAAISFIPKKDDDSHTNLGWLNAALETHPFPNGDVLRLNYKNFSLEWAFKNGMIESFLLDKATHENCVNWLSKISAYSGLKTPYKYNLHYTLPYPAISNATCFKAPDQKAIHNLIKKRDIAQDVISSVLTNNNYTSPIRIWPHHFDTGAFVTVNKLVSLGLGMAIPDTLIDDFYFYISGYNGHQPIVIEPVNSTHKETYYNNGWTGFAIATHKVDTQSGINFFQEAVNIYLSLASE